jgi:hypothetical protein
LTQKVKLCNKFGVISKALLKKVQVKNKLTDIEVMIMGEIALFIISVN